MCKQGVLKLELAEGLYKINKQKNKKLPAPVDIVSSDMAELGYSFEYQKVDSQKYLVRQRRNRVWGSANLQTCNTPGQYDVLMEKTMGALAADHQFDFAKRFYEDLPKETLVNKVFQMNLSSALQKAELIGKDPSDIFLDCSTSGGRSSHPEMAFGVSACVRPTHKI